MEIIIGREEGARRLHCVADGRAFNVGMAGSVPTSVSRQHCKLTIHNGSITIENLKVQNITFVDGNQIFCKTITANSNVQLGEDRFTVPLQQIVSLATSKLQPTELSQQPQVPTFSLKPLKSVWEEYDECKMAIMEEAAKKANRQRLQGILSLLGMCIGFISGIDQTIRIVIIIAALGIAIYFFMKGLTGDTVQKQIHDLDEEYAKKYKCPNPKCGRPFGAIPYRQIEFNKTCFSCGCKYCH